jgi:DNA repair exonuclease SbcCD ATPase subunit
VTKATALVEIFMTEDQKKSVKAFLQAPASFLQLAPPADETYGFKGGDVIETMENVEHGVVDKKFELEKQEMNSKASYDLAKKAQTQAITAATVAKAKKDARKSSAETALVASESTITTAESEIAASSDSLKSTEETCKQRAREWDERTKTREGEIKAMNEAVKVLQKADGVRPPAEAHAAAFIQLKQHSEPRASKAVALIKEGAKKYRNLQKLAAAADALAAPPGHGKNSGGPFHKMKQMMQKMIFQLKDEQKQEQEHKDWCDKEVALTKGKESEFALRQTKEENKIDYLTAEIEVSNGKLQQDQEGLKELTQDIAELKEARAEDSKENAIDIKDAQQAQAAIANAIKILTDFYKSSGAMPKEDWELVQIPSEPDTWSQSYSGSSGATGAISIIESIAADFAQMEIQARVAESTNQHAFEEDLEELEVDKARHEQWVVTGEKDLEMNQKKLSARSEALDNVKNQLATAEEYHDSLKPACYGDATSYDEVQAAFAKRQAALADEIEILKDAQKDLEAAFSM